MADDTIELLIVIVMCCFSSLLGGLVAYYTGKLCDYGYGCSTTTAIIDSSSKTPIRGSNTKPASSSASMSEARLRRQIYNDLFGTGNLNQIDPFAAMNQ